jgi:predicted negative regulator of RcsB-dependent stress response
VNFFKKMFAKNPEDFLAKGDRLLQDECFFEARSAFEEAFELLDRKKTDRDEAQVLRCHSQIAMANTGLAGLNVREAEFFITAGATVKAAEHLELAISLTEDPLIKKEAARLLAKLDKLSQHQEQVKSAPAPKSGCNSCSSGAAHAPAAAPIEPGMEMSDSDHFDLLTRQLPGNLDNRYANLGEKFIEAYLAISRDEHQLALTLLEAWFDGKDRDIFCYEKAMVLYRLGKMSDAERYLKEAISENNANPLPHLGLSLLLLERERFPEAATQLDSMIDSGILAEQATLLKGNAYSRTGDSEGAMNCYAALLTTSLARPAAENLHQLLLECGRETDAAAVFKKYLKGCGGH